MAEKEYSNKVTTTVEIDTTKAAQEVAKLNAIASDGTKELEERIEAKNKAVQIQNKLNEQAINQQIKKSKAIEAEINELKKLDGTEKKVLQLRKQLNSSNEKANKLRVKQTKDIANSGKALNGLNTKLEDSKSSMKNLDDATGGVISSFKAFISNPIGATLAVIAGLFQLLKESVNRSSEASKTFSKIGSKLSGILNGIIAVLEPLVEFLGEKLLYAIESPKEAFIELGQVILDNVINRFKSVVVLGDAIVALFEGDFEKAGKLAADAMIQFSTGVTDATDKMSEFGEQAAEDFKEAYDATENLVQSERRLILANQELEKQQLIHLRDAEIQRQIRDDVSRSMEDRIAANTELGRILEEQIAIEMQLAQNNLAMARSQVKATGATTENLEAVGDAELKLLEIQERITGQRSEQLVNEIALQKELYDRNFAAIQESLAAEIELKKLHGEDTYEMELASLERRMAEELSVKGQTQEEIKAIELRYQLEREMLEQESRDRKMEAMAREQEALLAIEQSEIERVALKLEEEQASEDFRNQAKVDKELALLNTLTDMKIASLDKQREAELANDELTAIERTAILQRYEDEANAIKADAANKSVEIEKSKAEMTKTFATDTYNVAKDLIGQMFGDNKAVALSIAGIDLLRGIMADVKLGFPAMIPAIASTTATGVATIKKIASTKPPSGIKAKTVGVTNVQPPSVSATTTQPSEQLTSLAELNKQRNTLNQSEITNGALNTASANINNRPAEVIFSENSYRDFQNQVKFKESRSEL